MARLLRHVRTQVQPSCALLQVGRAAVPVWQLPGASSNDDQMEEAVVAMIRFVDLAGQNCDVVMRTL